MKIYQLIKQPIIQILAIHVLDRHQIIDKEEEEVTTHIKTEETHVHHHEMDHVQEVVIVADGEDIMIQDMIEMDVVQMEEEGDIDRDHIHREDQEQEVDHQEVMEEEEDMEVVDMVEDEDMMIIEDMEAVDMVEVEEDMVVEEDEDTMKNQKDFIVVKGAFIVEKWDIGPEIVLI